MPGYENFRSGVIYDLGLWEIIRNEDVLLLHLFFSVEEACSKGDLSEELQDLLIYSIHRCCLSCPLRLDQMIYKYVVVDVLTNTAALDTLKITEEWNIEVCNPELLSLLMYVSMLYISMCTYNFRWSLCLYMYIHLYKTYTSFNCPIRLRSPWFIFYDQALAPSWYNFTSYQMAQILSGDDWWMASNWFLLVRYLSRPLGRKPSQMDQII